MQYVQYARYVLHVAHVAGFRVAEVHLAKSETGAHPMKPGERWLKDWADGALPAERGGAAALPRQDSNNCISPPTGADAKRAFQLRTNVSGFVKYWGREHTLFFTTTDGQNVSPRDYAKRWHSWLTNAGDWVRGFLKVLEPQKNGRPHYHNLVGVAFDVQPDKFDWEAFRGSCEAYQRKDWPAFRRLRAQYVASACPELRELWRRTREEMKAYGLGRCEILPVRKEGAISEYVGKYLEKGQSYRPKDWKGVRRVEMDRRTSREWSRCATRFSWSGIREDKTTGEIVRGGAVNWRRRVGELAFALGLPNDGDTSGIARLLGPKWGYTMRGAICTADQHEWEELLHSLAAEVGFIKAEVEFPAVPR